MHAKSQVVDCYLWGQNSAHSAAARLRKPTSSEGLWLSGLATFATQRSRQTRETHPWGLQKGSPWLVCFQSSWLRQKRPYAGGVVGEGPLCQDHLACRTPKVFTLEVMCLASFVTVKHPSTLPPCGARVLTQLFGATHSPMLLLLLLLSMCCRLVEDRRRKSFEGDA